jgi:molybdopterin biosynthesis enzyme
MNALRSYADALESWLARLVPLRAQICALTQAVGQVAAEDVRAPQPVPARALALRDGYELAAQAIAGASSYAPIVLASAPRFVAASEALSPDCDCVVEASGLDLDGPLPQALVESFPGENIRRAGEDFAQGALLLRAGEMISSQHALLLSQAGVQQVAVRAPVVELHGDDSLLAAYLRDQLMQAGARLDGAPDLVIVLGAKPSSQRLALEPGADLSFGEEQGVPAIYVPARLDQVFAALHGFVRPALARLSGAKAADMRLPLAQKIASRVGVAEFALLEAREGQFHPRALGDLPLQSLASATHVSLIAALSEGHAAGEVISAIPVRA